MVTNVQSLTGLHAADSSGRCVVLGGGVLAAIIISHCGCSGLNTRVDTIHSLLPLCHLHHPTVEITH